MAMTESTPTSSVGDRTGVFCARSTTADEPGKVDLMSVWIRALRHSTEGLILKVAPQQNLDVIAAATSHL